MLNPYTWISAVCLVLPRWVYLPTVVAVSPLLCCTLAFAKFWICRRMKSFVVTEFIIYIYIYLNHFLVDFSLCFLNRRMPYNFLDLQSFDLTTNLGTSFSELSTFFYKDFLKSITIKKNNYKLYNKNPFAFQGNILQSISALLQTSPGLVADTSETSPGFFKGRRKKLDWHISGKHLQ